MLYYARRGTTMEQERTIRDQGQEPQVVRVTQGHYRLFDSLTIALFVLFMVMMLGGCISAIVVMPTFVSLFEGMNLTLPLPTKIFIMMIKPGVGLLLLLTMGAAVMLLLMFLVVHLIRKARRDFIAAVINEMAIYLCLLLVMVFIFSMFLMAVFLPLHALMGSLR
jgi:hypothetical protein